MSEFPTCSTSQMRSVSVFGRAGTVPGNCPFYVGAVIPLENAVRKALKTRYGQVMQKTGIIWTYACRSIRGGTSHSEHQHPAAIDVNPPANPLRDDGAFICDFDKFSREDGAAFVNAFTSEGFKWGGNGYSTARIRPDFFAKGPNTSRIDPMHFEWDGPVVKKAQVRRYVRTAPRRAWNRVRRTVALASGNNRRVLRIARQEWERKVERE